MTEENKFQNEWKEKLKLTDKSTHFLKHLMLGEMVIIKGGWRSKNRSDVEKLVREKFPVNFSTENGGIIEIGFNQKFVGVHHYHRTIISNPKFKTVKQCIDWFFMKIEELEQKESTLDRVEEDWLEEVTEG